MNNGKYKQSSCEDLITLARQGDRKAYAYLLQDIMPLIKSYISKKVNCSEDTEDIVQEILLSIHQAVHTYNTDRPFKPWMFAIARYKLNDHLRMVYAHKNTVTRDSESNIHINSGTDIATTYENRDFLKRAIKSLPRKQRKIFSLMKVEGHSVKETAKRMHMTEGAVKVSAHRAYKALALKADEEEF